MPPRVDYAQLDRLLGERSFGQALPMADAATRAAPRDGRGWFALARAAFGVGRLAMADDAIDRAMRLGLAGPEAHLLRAVIDHRLARSEAAADRLRTLVRTKAPNAVDATLALAEVLHRARRHDELAELVAAGGPWTADPRAVIFTARVEARTDPAGTADRLEAFARGTQPAMARRIAGFDAVRMLDAAGEFRRAFELATHLHSSTGSPFDVDGLMADADAQLTWLGRLGRPPTPRAAATHGIALVVGAPRSGTTLLEQMLDRHPAISGIGEYDGIHTLGQQCVAAGVWPDQWAGLDHASATAMQQAYRSGASIIQRPGTPWTFDKSLHTWRWLPAVAAVLPGAACLRIQRSARDTAISLYLSNFHPQSFGWTRSLESIRAVLAKERQLAPAALHALGIPHQDFRYEDLVDRPAEVVERCLTTMGLAMDPAVLAPESNARTVLTLSHEQVRRPINRSSVDRWRNYAWAFGAEWDALD